jgi:chitodextrinase
VPDSATLTVGIRDPNETDDGSGGNDGGGTSDDGTDGAGDGPDSGFGAPGEDADASDGSVGVKVFFDGEADVDPGDVEVSELEELPEDGAAGEPDAVIDRGQPLLPEDDGVTTVKGSTIVTEAGQQVTLTGARSHVRTAEAVDSQRRVAAVVDITPSSELRDRTATVQVRIDREEFPGSDPTGARIARLTPQGWQLLPTEVTEADDESVLVEARTYGFSVFTVFTESQVDYEWTLPDGTTVSGERLRTTFEEPGVRNVTLTVTDSAGRSDNATKQVVVNDEPSVGIEGASNATAGEMTTLRADVTDKVGNVTVIWTLPDGTETTGRTVTGEFDAGDQVRVTVKDEFGAAGRAETTISTGGLARPALALRATGPPISVLAAVVLALLTTGLVGLLARSQLPEATGDGIYALLRELRSWVVDDSPRVTVVGNPTWNPESGCIEIEELRVEAPAGRLDTVEVTVTDDAGTQVVRKEIEVDSGSSYVATPERIHAYGEITLSDDATYDVGVRATDELDRVGTVDRPQSSPLARPQ